MQDAPSVPPACWLCRDSVAYDRRVHFDGGHELPVPFTTLMQETWDAALDDMDRRHRGLADSWRMAFDAAHDGLEAMRDIWPRRRESLVDTRHEDAVTALRDFEDAYVRIVGMAEDVAGSDFAAAINDVDTRDV